MATKVLMPKLGLTMTEGTIEEWKVKEGDAVQVGDVLFSVATDKLTNDVECDTEGILLKILLPEGETAPCKSIVAWIGQVGEAIPGVDADTAVNTTVSIATATTVLENMPSVPANGTSDGVYVPATPLAKKLAKEKGYDLTSIPGTGPNGVIVAKDVEKVTVGPKISPMAAKLAAEKNVDISKLAVQGRVMKADVLAASTGNTTVEGNDLPPVKVNPLRRSIAANMSASWSISPRVTYTHPVDVTAMKDLRARLKEPLAKQGIKLTYNHILMKVVAKALVQFPDINASFADNMLTRHIHVNMGLAVAKGDGLIVPNVKNCDEKSLTEIAKETEALIESARSGSISLTDITGGTFTISSLGAYGITQFSPIINQPELAILGVCDMVDTPVVREGQVVVRPMMNLCLTADHRVVDGVMASKFLQYICKLLEDPCLMLL